jgi:hypothetical protein
MASNLVPERPLVFSPTLAATIGLEEAILLQVLMDFAAHRPGRLQDDYSWVEVADQELQKALPFWKHSDIGRIVTSLCNLGMILRRPEPGAENSYLYALNEKADSTAQHPPASVNREPTAAVHPAANVFRHGAAASSITADWMPDEEWLVQCRHHNIPDEFSLSLVAEFVSYWRDRGEARFSWGNAFFSHVRRRWREEQTRQGARELASSMHREWQPSPDALEILVNAGIAQDFIEDAIPEFVLYWRERGIRVSTWNTKFIEHIRRQWNKYNASFGQDDTPRVIPPDWQPSPACFEILQLAEIDADYARGKLPEFVLYWRDSKQVRSSWNTVFLQYIKQDWARRLQAPLEVESGHGEHRSAAGESRHSVEEKLRQLTDRSWAESARRW